MRRIVTFGLIAFLVLATILNLLPLQTDLDSVNPDSNRAIRAEELRSENPPVKTSGIGCPAQGRKLYKTTGLPFVVTERYSAGGCGEIAIVGETSVAAIAGNSVVAFIVASVPLVAIHMFKSKSSKEPR